MWIHVLVLISTCVFKASSEGTSSYVAGTTSIGYGTEGILTCDIKSSAPIRIHWYYTEQTTGKINEIMPSDKYWISANGTELRIKEMDFDMVGNYVCSAAYSQRVEIVLTAPEITGKSERRAIRGSNVLIECNIIKGLPKPKVIWEYMDKTVSKFTTIPVSGNVLRLVNVTDENAGRYKCVAENKAGKDEHITTLVIESPPRIFIKSTAYDGFEGGTLKIPCDVVGIPQPVITWKRNDYVLMPNKKYTIEGGALIIRNLIEEDSSLYTCEAKNYIAIVYAVFKATVKTAPRITGVNKIRAIRGYNVAIVCNITRGVPKPKITWEYMNQTGSKFTPLNSTGNVLSLSSVEEKSAGRYMCVAENEAGKHEHITTLVIEFAPRMISKPSTVYGLVGDLALRIPSYVVGVPQSVFTWELNGSRISPNEKYRVEDGALIIMNPVKEDASLYECEAKNYLGSVHATFAVKVEELISGLETNQRYVYLLKDETRKLQCEGYNSTSQSVRWFIENVEVHSGKPYLEVVKANFEDEGNYTCRLTDKHGNTHTYTYVVDVGYPPKLYEQIPMTDWRGDPAEILSNCENIAKPDADVKWEFNDQLLSLSYQNLSKVGATLKWGKYKCTVTNVHGSVQRSFNVQSSVCLIHRQLEDIQNMPLLLGDELTYPDLVTTEHNLIVEHGDKITLSCPYQSKDAPNTFQKFPKRSILKASCHKEDEFLVDDKSYRLLDLLCSKIIQPSVVQENTKCLTKTSEYIEVGYNVESGFLKSYEICFDHAINMPLFIRVLLTETDSSLSTAFDWYSYPGIGNDKLNRGFTCKNLKSTCCYDKIQLVNPSDFKYDYAKKSTFLEFLNTVPYWRPCTDSKQRTTWEDINDMVKYQVAINSQIVAWSGTHTFQEKDGVVVPRYLWKVLKFDEDESIAIVHVNDQAPTTEDIKCKDISSTDDVNDWFTSNDNFTYCCTLSSFIEAFDLSVIDFTE